MLPHRLIEPFFVVIGFPTAQSHRAAMVRKKMARERASSKLQNVGTISRSEWIEKVRPMRSPKVEIVKYTKESVQEESIYVV